MVTHSNKQRKYQSPRVSMADVVYACNICSATFVPEVDQLRNINKEIEAGTSAEPDYFEF